MARVRAMEGLAVFLLVVMVVGISAMDQCNSDKYRQMQRDFRECSVGFTSKSGLSACEIITKVMNVCGEQWKLCYGPREVQEMKDTHIARYDQQYGGENGLGNCQITQEFRSSGRKAGEEVGPMCTDTKTTQVQEEFQQCSHEAATQLYRAGLDLTAGDKTINQLLCQTLKTMLTTCTEPLTECLSPEDVEQMRESTEETQKKFLVKILDGKVTEEEANRCGVLKEKGGPPISPIAPVSSQKMPIPPVGQPSGTKMPIPPIEGGSAVNSVREGENKVLEPPIGDVTKEKEPQVGLGSPGTNKVKEENDVEAEAVKEEAAAQKQGGQVVQLVQPSFKSKSPSRNVLGAFWLLCLLALLV